MGDKFLLIGEDKKTLTDIKNTLVSEGNIYIGYISEVSNILRGIRKCYPDLILLDAHDKFQELMPTIKVIDEELLTACILLLKVRNEDILHFVRQCRVVTYLHKPIHSESIIQLAELSLLHFRRVLDYEQKLKQLNKTLESRKVVEKAKWLLVAKDGVTENEAYEIIRKKSRDNRIPMRDIAEAIILTHG